MPPPVVLAIDDSITIRKLLQMALTGFQVEVAASGREGIEAAGRVRPSAIVLDYVLPDMKGFDVVMALEADPATRHIPVVVLSGKNVEELKPVFRERPAVKEVLGKPFNGPSIAAVIQRIVKPVTAPEAAAPAADAGAAPVFTPAQRRAAAQAMFTRLRERLAAIPAWLPQLGAEPPAVFFAKRLLTEDVVDKLLPDLAKLLGTGSGGAGASEEFIGGPPSLSGDTRITSLSEVLGLLGGGQRTGVLALDAGDLTTLLYLRRGEVLTACCNRPDEAVRAALLGADPKMEAAVLKAEAEQKRSGKPLYVSLVEAGLLPASELAELLAEQAGKLASDAFAAKGLRFRFRELGALPAWVEAAGRPMSLEVMELERLRDADDRVAVEAFIPGMDVVFARAEGFSSRAGRLPLTDAERCVLTLIDGRNTVGRVVERGGTAPYETFRILFRMSRLGIIRKTTGPAAGKEPVLRAALVMDGDREGVAEPLAELLSRRRGLSVSVADVDGDPMARLLRDRPRLAIIDADAAAAVIDPESLARRVRGTLEISDMVLAFSCGPESADREPAWRRAGADAVLVKPFPLTELDGLLESA